MPRPCRLCQHPEREAIEQALAAQEPYRKIAERYGMSLAALHRHQQAHVQPHANTVHLGAPLHAGAPDPRAAALLDTAQRLHTTACELQRRTIEVRSLHDPKLLQHVEELARLHVEVTGLHIEVTGLLGERLTAPAPPPPQPPGPWLRSDLAGEVGRLHATVLQLAYHPARVLEVLQTITRVLVELSMISLPPAHPLQTPDVAALPWPQWHQEARALVEQLDRVFDAWSVPGPAQRVLRQMAALLVQMTAGA